MRFGNQPMRVRTIFISSRMEELAMERQSAFDAIYEAGLTPILFEMEPRSAERKKIDALVDRADLFLGVFYQTIGTPNENLCGLCPVEYELYRFLTRFDVCPHPESCQLTEDDRDEISRRMDDRDYLRDLQARLRRECKKEEGEVFDVVKARVRLFLRVLRQDNSLSRKLAELLDGMPVERFGNAAEPPPEVIRFLQERRYIPSHMDLFHRIFSEVSSALATGRIQRIDPDIKTQLCCRVKGPDQPGLLFTVLDACFSKALNIKSLSIDKPAAGAPCVELSVLAEHFYQTLAEVSPEQLDRALRYRLTRMGHVYEVSCAETPAGESLEVHADQIPEGLYYYEILTFDVPGIIMLVARLVAHFGGNIEFIHFGDHPMRPRGSSHYSALILAIRPVADGCRIQRDGGITLEYELEALLGVVTVFRLSLEDVQERFRSFQPRRYAVAGAAG
jgi:hypothetical protein